MIIAGSKIYEKCATCEKLVCVNKTIFGSLHFCLTPAEIVAKQHAQAFGWYQQPPYKPHEKGAEP